MRVEFTAVVELPDGTPDQDIQAWLEFNLGCRADLSNKNALADTDLISVGCQSVDVRS